MFINKNLISHDVHVKIKTVLSMELVMILRYIRLHYKFTVFITQHNKMFLITFVRRYIRPESDASFLRKIIKFVTISSTIASFVDCVEYLQ